VNHFEDFEELNYDSDDLKEGIDYYLSPEGFRVMSKEYLTRRGYCCANGCLNCPYWPKARKGNTVLRK